MADSNNIMKILAIIGALILFVAGILGFFGSLVGIIIGFVDIVLAIIILLSCLRPGNPIPFSKIVILILGIIALILGIVGIGWLGITAGIIIIIGAIIAYVM